jgi:hypothetical protein
MSTGRVMRGRALGALLRSALALSALGLAGCSISIADLPLGGTSAEAPQHPKDADGYLPVNERPPDREETVIDPTERARIARELIAARERQASAAGAKETKENKDAKDVKDAKDPTAK